MTRHSTAIVAVWVIVSSSFAVSLTAQAPLRFEVASVRPSPSVPVGPIGLRISPSEARFTWIPLKGYIAMAFGVRDFQIDGPNWLISTRFDIAAKIPEGQRAPSQVAAMLRALLQERFRLRTRTVRRELPVYGLEVAPRGPALKRIPDEAPPDGPLSILNEPSGGSKVTTYSDGASLALGNSRFEARRMTMARLADALTTFVDRPVVDMTNLDGRYDVAFTLSPEDFVAMMRRSVAASGFVVHPDEAQALEAVPVAVRDALESAGLLLRTRTAPLDVLVIDGVERVPTAN